ncbi:MAG: hypothetical protein ACMUHU_01425 [Thermoplasmatota archaeon]
MNTLDTECPKCGRHDLKREYMDNGKYRIVCGNCGLTRGEFVPDRKKGVV